MVVEAWRQEYNHRCANRRLGYLAPIAFAKSAGPSLSLV